MRFLFMLLPLCLFADYSPQKIADELKSAGIKHGIDVRVLYTIAKLESQFTPLVISFVSKNTNHNFKNLNKKIRKYKDSYIITLYGTENDLQSALRELLKDKKLRVDVGLMQINSVNFKTSEIDKIFKLQYNIDKSSEILKKCISLKINFKDSIECYNKGTKKAVQYSYYNRFKTSFHKDFAYE